MTALVFSNVLDNLSAVLLTVMKVSQDNWNKPEPRTEADEALVTR